MINKHQPLVYDIVLPTLSYIIPEIKLNQDIKIGGEKKLFAGLWSDNGFLSPALGELSGDATRCYGDLCIDGILWILILLPSGNLLQFAIENGP